MKKMPLRRVPVLILIFCLIAMMLSSCLVRRRAITRKGAGASKAPTLLTANRDTLLNEVAKQYSAVHDFSATVDMVPALGSVEKNKVTEYKDVRAYILYRAPADIRLIGLYPVVRNTAFDMVSTGPTFNLYVPSRNRFITGRNEIIQPSTNKLENLRPSHFLDAIVVHPVTPADKVLLENLTDEDDASYILHLIREPAPGELRLTRTIWFSRVDLTLSRQLILDDSGNILTDARYRDWREFDNVRFPKHIEINRPRDEYGVVIDVVKMDINKGVSDDKFVLKQPEGSVRQVVGEARPQ
jgi:outer membrane lipoprotein-sorting protein